jgi:hypothetical protein
MLAPAKFAYVAEHTDAFFELFPHRFDYIYANHPEPAHYPDRRASPDWQTESRHPLTDRLLAQGSYLYGVRFGAKTRYCLLDIDAGSVYHPNRDTLAISRLLAALEPLGIVSYLACTSSYSSGIHLYFPLSSPQSSWELGAAVTITLENAGFAVKPGQLEVFPNRKSYSVQGKPSLFNAHRLPLQMGSYLLNRDFEPIWSSRASFVQQWQTVQTQNQIAPGILRQILRQSQRKHYQVSGKAAKFINDLNAEIEPGWTGYGQTNYLLGRIAMRVYIFHHVLEGGAPLTGKALIQEIISTAQQLPGYRDWCQHQHEIEHRAAEWARCVESSDYFHYGSSNNQFKLSKFEELNLGKLSWNQQQSQNTRDRIRATIADLLNQNALPAQATARFKLLTAVGIGGGSLYRHKDLWHPKYLNFKSIENTASTVPEETSIDLLTPIDQLDLESEPHTCSTSLLPALGGNVSSNEGCSRFKSENDDRTGGNASPDQVSKQLAGATGSVTGFITESVTKSAQSDSELVEPIEPIDWCWLRALAMSASKLDWNKLDLKPP